MVGQDALDGPTRGWGLLRRTALAGSSIPRFLLGVAVAAAVVVIAVKHRGIVDAGGDSLAAADRDWLVLAALATAAIWIAGTISQLGSMPVRPPFGRLLAVQAAASFVNHLLPAGSGGIGINIRFLRRHGLDSGAAASATGLNALAGFATHVLLLVAAVVMSPTLARQVRAPGSWDRVVTQATGVLLWGAGVVGAILLLAAIVLPLRANWRRLLADKCAAGCSRVVHELRRLGSVVRNPYRAAALWLGSLSTPLLHAMVLFAVVRSLGVALTVGTAVVVYVVVSSFSAVVPSPGGLGALDVALLAGLVAVGISPTVALAAVLGYRLITVWVPFLPGALVLTVLLRRRII